VHVFGAAQDRDKRRDFVIMVMNIRIPLSVANFLTKLKTGIFQEEFSFV
jgi:hypothetical protein